MQIAYSSTNFAKSFFFDVTKFQIAWLQIVRSQNELNMISQMKGMLKQAMGHLFITSSNSYFFNKSDLERYLCD